MKFTKENWENAPEGARLEYQRYTDAWEKVHLIGYMRDGTPAVELPGGCAAYPTIKELRITLAKRKVMVRLWRMGSGQLATSYVNEERWAAGADWTLLGEHTFEIEGE